MDSKIDVPNIWSKSSPDRTQTFQDLDLCSKTVIIYVVAYIGMQQLRENENCDLDLTSFTGAVLAFL